MKDLAPTEVRAFFAPEGRLRLEARGQSWLKIKPVWAAPVSDPGRWLAVLDGQDKEIFTVERVEDLPIETREVLLGELKKRYLTSTVHKILEVRVEFGIGYWRVATERGEREFVTQSLQENAQWVSPDHIVIADVDGNHYEIPSVKELDKKSRKELSAAV